MSHSRGNAPRRPYRPPPPNLPYRPTMDIPNGRSRGDGHMYQFGTQSRPRSDFTFRSRIAERDLLTHVPSNIETPVLSQYHTGNKFRDVENLTDSEEEEMSEDDDNDVRPKRRRIAKDETQEEAQIKWSNPDPYTVLPPAPESSHKRVDFVKLIRKARNEPNSQGNKDANQADFISFDNLGDDDHFPVMGNGTQNPRPDSSVRDLAPDQSHSRKILGKRKHDAFEEDTLMGSANRTQYHKSGKVLATWQPMAEHSATPWLKSCSPDETPMTALHKEIIDFYEWVKPKDFEAALRHDLVIRLGNELRRWKPGGKLEAFGSYAAGLYLPTGDMDLVYNYNKAFQHNAKRDVREVTSFLKNCNIAQPGSLIPIPFAKVPIVKFVDRLTGLKVDLSFNNYTGIVANETFKKWQVTYPAVTIIVAVIKQFLMIRGLNDNASGGLGGFATICMVTSLVQNLPQESQNLGELLIEFFNLYGNLLKVEDVGIRLDPPGYINKKTHRLMCDEKPDRLVIIDPNQADNNITGGSDQYIRITGVFSRIHAKLSSQLDEFAHRDQHDDEFSFLTDVIGGNFAAYAAQRAALFKIYNPGRDAQEIYDDTTRPKRNTRSAPEGIAKVNQNATATDAGLPTPNVQSSKVKPCKGATRLATLRTHFPELVNEMAKLTTISTNEALRIGGWRSGQEMSCAIIERQKAPQTQGKKAKKGRK